MWRWLLLVLTGCAAEPPAPDLAGVWLYEWPTHAPDGGPLTLHGSMDLQQEGNEVHGIVGCPTELADQAAYWNWSISGPLDFLFLASDHQRWDDDFVLRLTVRAGELLGPMLPAANPSDDHRGYVFRARRPP